MSNSKQVASPQTMSPVYFRAPDTLLAEVDVYRQTLEERAGVGVLISRSAAIHQLIREGLTSTNAARARKRGRK